MRIIPVIDLKAGQVVRGVAGRREQYRPITSGLAADSCPASIARAFVEQFSFEEVYVADLDAIGGAAPNWRALEQIARCGLRMWVDAGVSSVERASRLARFAPNGVPLASVIVGLESIANAALLSAVFHTIGGERSVFSLDLRHGRPCTTSPGWRRMDGAQISSAAYEIGFRRLVVLDLAQVGTGKGCAVQELCARLRAVFPACDLIAGGGIRGVADLLELANAGCRAALVASALHDGRLTAAEIQDVSRRRVGSRP